MKYLIALGRRYDHLRWYYKRQNRASVAPQGDKELASSYDRIQNSNEAFLGTNPRSESYISAK